MHILTAVTLVVPLGLLECSPRLKDCSSTSCVLEDAAEKDIDSLEQHEHKQPCLLFEVLRPLGSYPSVRRAALSADIVFAGRSCIEMHGCRPPPAPACC